MAAPVITYADNHPTRVVYVCFQFVDVIIQFEVIPSWLFRNPQTDTCALSTHVICCALSTHVICCALSIYVIYSVVAIETDGSVGNTVTFDVNKSFDVYDIKKNVRCG